MEMRKVAVLCAGHTRFMFNSPKTQIELLAEAAMDAIGGSSLKPRDVHQAIFCGNVLGGFTEGQIMVQSYFADDIGCWNVPANRYEGACASATMAIRDAFMWVASGFYDIVLAGGVEKATSMGTSLATRTFAMGGDSRYEYPAGSPSPVFLACWLICTQNNTTSLLPSLKNKWPSSPFNRTITARRIPTLNSGKK